MVAAFNSATGSREARESLSEANKGYKECTEVNYGAEVKYPTHALVGSCGMEMVGKVYPEVKS